MAAPTQAPGPVNFQALLQSDPTLQTALGQINQAATADKTALTGARQSALIGYGSVPQDFDSSLVGNISPDITAATRQEAQANTDAGTSTVAQLAQKYNQNQETAANNARLGGGTGGLFQDSLANQQGNQVATANAQTSLLGGLSGLQNTYQGQQQALAGQAQTATGTALSNLTGQIEAGLIASPTARTKAPAAPRSAPRSQFSSLVARNTTGYQQPTSPSLRPLAAPSRKPLP